MEQNCVQILAQSLEKKSKVLDGIIEQNNIQETILKQDKFDMDTFEKSVDEQNRLIAELDKLDSGFELVYERTREEMLLHKARYSKEIALMQTLIQQITDKIVTINAGNLRNKRMAENQFRKERIALQQNVSKSRVARDYYNNMNKLNCVAPQFYDSKK